MTALERRVDERVRAEFPLSTAPRPGGSADTLIKLAASIAAEEAPIDYQGFVREFHEAFGHPVADRPTLVDEKLYQLRFDLIQEELNEYLTACVTGDVTGIADALGDILYVTFGAGLVHGINLGPIFEEIQRSNMTKLGLDGKPVYREDGKILKGPNYETPQLGAIVLTQQEDGAWG